MGWVAGRDANLLSTQDGGATWRALPEPGGPGSDVLQLRFADATHGWAVSGTNPSNGTGGNVAVFATADGGQTWTRQWWGPWTQVLDSLTMQMRVRIEFFGLQDGLVLVGGTLLTTHDGGDTWRAAPFPGKGFTPEDASFIDAQTGWVVGERPAHHAGGRTQLTILATSDGGRTWAATAVPPQATPYLSFSGSIGFVDGQHGWLDFKDDGLSGHMFQTADGGRTWTALQVPGDLDGRTAAGTVSFVGKGVGWLPVSGGASPFLGAVLLTKDGGRTWQTASSTVSPDERFSAGAVSPVSAQEAWVITDRPGKDDRESLLHTTDGGRTWQRVLPQTTAN